MENINLSVNCEKVITPDRTSFPSEIGASRGQGKDDSKTNLKAPKRHYNLSTKALHQRQLAAKQRRYRGSAVFLKILDEVFNTKFRRLLVRYSTRILKEQCKKCRRVKNER
jgi:hypothetical protein